jgi:hypothetical protein
VLAAQAEQQHAAAIGLSKFFVHEREPEVCSAKAQQHKQKHQQ